MLKSLSGGGARGANYLRRWMASTLKARTLARKQVQWDCETDGGWQPYDDAVSQIIERKRLSGTGGLINLSIGKWTYTVNLDTMTQTNDTTKKTRKIRQRVVELPASSLPLLSLQSPMGTDEVMRLAESNVIQELTWYRHSSILIVSFSTCVLFYCNC